MPNFQLQATPWATLLNTGLKLLILVAVFLLLRYVLRILARRTEKRMATLVSEPNRLNRLRTVLWALYAAAVVVMALVVLAMGLQLFGLSIGPLLASAGVVGLAISLGAQTLIKDYLSGMLILVEDQFRVGDWVQVGDVSGEVARMTLRSTQLRTFDGKLFFVPNGDIRIIGNLTRDWSRAVVDFNLPRDADSGRVDRALADAVERLKADEALSPLLLEEPQVLRWLSLGDWSVQARIMAKTPPGKQGGVAMALRQYATEALRAESIPLATPTVQILQDKPG